MRNLAVIFVSDVVGCCGLRDLIELTQHFIQSSYEVRTFWNLKYVEMEKQIKIISSHSSELKSLTVVCVSHTKYCPGSKLELFDAADGPVNVKNWTTSLNQFPNLKDIPKIFIISVCRGNSKEKDFKYVNCSGFLPFGEKILEPNSLMYYSVAPYGKSCCDKSSLLVDLFCKQYIKYKGRSFCSMLTSVNKLWGEYGVNTHIPVLSSTLTEVFKVL